MASLLNDKSLRTSANPAGCPSDRICCAERVARGTSISSRWATVGHSSSIGPGLRAGLAVLRDAGDRIVERWSRLDVESALELEVSAVEASWRSAARFDESRPSVRWDAYGRIGAACAILRRAGRTARAVAAK